MKYKPSPSYRPFLLVLFLAGYLTIFNSYGHNGSNGHEHIHEINVNYHLFNICKNDIEGYTEKLSGGDYNYPSLREDLGQAMISRASTGKMAFEFLTGKVPSTYDKPQVSFFFLSNIDLNLREPYDIAVNGQPILTFLANEDGTLKILDNPGDGRAEYILIKRDHNGDGIGAFRLTVPTNKIKKGAQAKIRVTGHNKGSNSWFMIFKGTDVVSRLKVSATNEAAFSIKQDGDLMHIDAPGHFEGRGVQLKIDGKNSKKVKFVKDGGFAKASVKALPPNNRFSIVCQDISLDINFSKGDGISTQTEIVGSYFLYHKTSFQNGWNASLMKVYRPGYINVYTDFFENRYENGKVTIMNSSHQDIAWVDRPEVCIILRDTLLLTPILKDAFTRSDYGFDIEDGLMLWEYLHRHPEAKDKITTLLNNQLISVGATYNCPYEDMYDAEDQVRQLYLGKKWVKKTFGGYDSKVYWNVDVPGKSLQTPQILKKAGVDYMVISRHAKGMFHWKSPDGSSVFTYSPGHYGNDLIHLSKEMGNKIKYGAEQVLYWNQYYENSEQYTPLLSSQDMLPAIDYSNYIDSWNGFKNVKDEEGIRQTVYFPEMELMTVDEFMPLAEKNATIVDTIQGERPNVWLYIHGPSHHYAITASREGSKLLPAAEKFLSVANLLDPRRMPYPTKEIDKAWRAKIFPDHGWGGHDGDITDDLFKEKLVLSRSLGEKLLDKATGFIAGQVKTDENLGIPLILFNSLSWDRTDPVTISIQLQQGEAKNLIVSTHDNSSISTQLSDIVYYNDKSIKSADVTFVANVPSIGYNTYYLQKLQKIQEHKEQNTNVSLYENKFYRVTFDEGGISQIYDKALSRNLFKTDNYMVADIFTLQSIGNGAGEFGDVQQPFMKDFDKVSKYKSVWKIIESGKVFSTYRMRQQILNAIVEQDVTIYHELKRILFETKLINWTGAMYREFRTAFPLAIEDPKITYEVPFGSVQVGKDEIKTAGERYTPLCKNVHPRAILDWISASDDELTVTLSSSVAVADWLDPSGDTEESLLQHILLASRKSCHWEGNEYSQAGNHSFHNILTSNSTGDISGTRMAKQQNDPIQVIVYPAKIANANLPEQTRFFNIDQENVIITAIKKAEDSDQIVVRMYDSSGVEATVNLDSYFDLGQLQKSNIIEEYPINISKMNVGKYGIETFMLDVKK